MGKIIKIEDYKVRQLQQNVKAIAKDADKQIELALELGACDQCGEMGTNFTMINNECLCDKCYDEKLEVV